MDTSLALIISCVLLVVFPLLALGLRLLLDRFARSHGDEDSFLPKVEPEEYGKGADVEEGASGKGVAEEEPGSGSFEEVQESPYGEHGTPRGAWQKHPEAMKSMWNEDAPTQASETEPQPLRSARGVRFEAEPGGLVAVPIDDPTSFQIDTVPADDRGGCLGCGCK